MPNLNPCKNCKHCQQWEFGKQRPTKRYCMHETAKYETALSKADADCYDDDD